MQAISQNIGQSSNDVSADSGRNPGKRQKRKPMPIGAGREFWPNGIVASPLLRMTKRRVSLRALSQNRASASRVSLCYGL